MGNCLPPPSLPHSHGSNHARRKSRRGGDACGSRSSVSFNVKAPGGRTFGFHRRTRNSNSPRRAPNPPPRRRLVHTTYVVTFSISSPPSLRSADHSGTDIFSPRLHYISPSCNGEINRSAVMVKRFNNREIRNHFCFRPQSMTN